jgi:hypothetical protein
MKETVLTLRVSVPEWTVGEEFGQRLYENVQAYVDSLYEEGKIGAIRGDR